MGTEYATDVKHFVTHEDVTWRESMAGSSVLLGVGVLASLVALGVWWRRREA